MGKKIFTYRKKELPNILKIVQLVLCCSSSNKAVKSSFSILTAMLSDRRLSMSHETMEDNMIISSNAKVLTEQEKEVILQNAMNKYLTNKRHKTNGIIYLKRS